MNKDILRSYLILAIIALFLSSCSFADSSKSSSSPSRSSSKSSKGSTAEVKQTQNSYQEEVSSLAIIYADSKGVSQNFQRELSQISSRHGITDWGSDRQTFYAIGKGLNQANVPKDSIKDLPFLQEIKTLSHYWAIFDGYEGK